jgi:hypothetical protein
MSRLVASDGKFDGLSGRALEIAADGADGWEVQLFAQLLRDELAASADAKRLHDVGGVIGPHAQVHESEMISWLHARLNETSRMIADAETILPRILNEALAQNEPKSLAFAARHIAQVYRQYLAWAAQVRGAIVPEAWHEVADQLARIYDESLAAIAATPDQIDHEVERAKETGLSLVRVPLRLNFDVEKLKVAIRRVQPDIQFE